MLPTIGITAGDPAGIGLEVVLKSISTTLPLARWVLFADRFVFERNRMSFTAGMKHKWIGSSTELTDVPMLFVREVGGASDTGFGNCSRGSGERALAYLKTAGEEALSGASQAVVTAPVSKEASGDGFHGQTEFLVEIAGVRQVGPAFLARTFT